MRDTPDILKTIIARKTEEIRARRERIGLRDTIDKARRVGPTRGFASNLRATLATGRPAVIAEIKKASPSAGVLRENFDPPVLAASYQAGGATCLSVLTDRDFFQGGEADLQRARAACALPVIRKDFTIDAYQVYEARGIGADCVLLIASVLGDATLAELLALAHDLHMDALVEVHDSGEMRRVLDLGVDLIGINNRNLRTFDVDLGTTLNMLPLVPDGVLLVTESGIHTPEQVALMCEHGVDAFLVGEALMRAADPGVALAALFSQ